MPFVYNIEDSPEAMDNPEQAGSSALQAAIYTQDDFLQTAPYDSDVKEVLGLFMHSQGTFAHMLPDCIIGSCSFPDKDNLSARTNSFGFYLDPTQLILIDNSTKCKQVLDSFSTAGLIPFSSTAHLLLELIKYFVHDDTVFLADIEAEMSDVEGRIIDRHKSITSQELLGYRRKLLKLDLFYDQLAELTDLISKDEYRLLAKPDRRLFRLFSQQAERLLQRSQYLKEYSLQLRELYQTQIDTQQNKTIQWLTVVTTLVVPLTLITSWYGMNFKNMPELDWPYSYVVIIAVCITIVIVQLIFFKKRKWL